MTLRPLIPIIIGLCLIGCSRKASHPNDPEYRRQVRGFIDWFAKSRNWDTLKILQDEIDTSAFDFLMLTRDTTDLTEQDRDELRSYKNDPSIKTWTPDIAGDIRLVPGDSIEASFKDSGGDRWNTFHSKFGHGYYYLSYPVFLHNYTLCLMRSTYYCGSLCAEGKDVLYRKVGDHWEEVRILMRWVS